MKSCRKTNTFRRRRLPSPCPTQKEREGKVWESKLPLWGGKEDNKYEACIRRQRSRQKQSPPPEPIDLIDTRGMSERLLDELTIQTKALFDHLISAADLEVTHETTHVSIYPLRSEPPAEKTERDRGKGQGNHLKHGERTDFSCPAL